VARHQPEATKPSERLTRPYSGNWASRQAPARTQEPRTGHGSYLARVQHVPESAKLRRRLNSPRAARERSLVTAAGSALVFWRANFNPKIYRDRRARASRSRLARVSPGNCILDIAPEGRAGISARIPEIISGITGRGHSPILLIGLASLAGFLIRKLT
jgi:hypothetical protein